MMTKNTTENGIEILENMKLWDHTFRSGWLAEFEKTGIIDWKLYNPPKNKSAINGKGVGLSNSRLMLVSSAGAYLADSQQPFDASNPLGDYTIRKLSASTQFKELAYAHKHYDHTAVNADPQVLLPLEHLREMVEDNFIGELSTIVSFMGYQPNVTQVVEETIPAILKIANEEKANAALLVPS
jgi:D-proline reductase (dithiol) PrdB